MTLMMIILAVCGGATLSVQAAINGQLGSRVGVFKSAFLTFSVGALVTALLIFFLNQNRQSPCWTCRNGSFSGRCLACRTL